MLGGAHGAGRGRVDRTGDDGRADVGQDNVAIDLSRGGPLLPVQALVTHIGPKFACEQRMIAAVNDIVYGHGLDGVPVAGSKLSMESGVTRRASAIGIKNAISMSWFQFPSI